MTAYYLYQTTNNINGMIYVGVHQTKNINDGYLGSGTKLLLAIKKHGKQHFSKVIIEFFSSSSEMFNREAEIVNQEFVERKDTYNLRCGGKGGGKGRIVSEETRQKLRACRLGSKRSPDTINKIKQSKKNAIGRKHTAESKAKMSLIRKGVPKPPRSAEHSLKISVAHIKRLKDQQKNYWKELK